jgi:hypothetical protein
MVEAQKVSMSQLHNIEVQFIVLMFTQLCNSSCFQSQASLSVCVTNLFVVDVSLISSAFNTTAHVLVFTLVTGAVYVIAQ